jgi:ubiquitin thioesterase OTU1
MRLRIRGPAGQSTVTLDDESTVETLRKAITAETTLSAYDVKYGYPPKPLALDRYAPATKLRDLEVRLNGEQLIVSKSDTSGSQTVIKREDVSAAGPSRTSAAKPSQQPSSSTSSEPKEPSKSVPPLSLNRKNPFNMSDPPEIILPELGGTLVLRIMPDDNSCLFRAIASAVMSGLDMMTEMRSIVAQTVQANPEKYTKAVLDNKNPDDYCRWIQTEDAWGGQIELDIFSRHFDIEICSIDVQRLRVDRYNENASHRCILVYSGIHYDTIAFSLGGAPPDEDLKIFEPVIKNVILPHAVELCRKLQEKHYYTDTAGFSIKCNDCGATCIGEAGAQAHAKKTGHYNFGES